MIHKLISALILLTFYCSASADDYTICETPTILDKFEDIQGARRFVLIDDRAYMLNELGRELVTLDISDPSNIAQLNTLDLGMTEWTFIVAHNNALYLTEPGHAIQVIDITTPDLPSVGQMLPVNSLVHQPVVNGNYMYAGKTDIFDVSNPTNPIHAGNMALGYELAYAQGPDAYTTRVQHVDLSDPLAPVTTSPTNDGDNDYAHIDVDQTLNRMYVWTDHSLELYDISDPTNPTQPSNTTQTTTQALSPRTPYGWAQHG